MASPQVYGPDQVLRDDLIFSTTNPNRFFQGTCDADTAALEISFLGDSYTQDSSLIVFEGTTWLAPNPEVYPEGFALDQGSNTILVRSLLTSGSYTAAASITVTVVSASVASAAEPPTNLILEQRDLSVVVSAEAPTASSFVGMNVYASTLQGGGETGYVRINVQPLTTGATQEEEAALSSWDADAALVTGVDPLYVRVVGTQENAEGGLEASDFSERVEVPETAERVRTSVALTTVRDVHRFQFEHSRSATRNSTPATIYLGAFAALALTEPLYYVVTALYYDTATQQEVESPFSVEVVGHPLQVSTTPAALPAVSRQAIVRDMTLSLFRSNPQIKVEPGSFVRDTFIDPGASELERVRFVLDFVYRSRAFSSLLQIDDPGGTGQSQPVAISPYKQLLKSAFSLDSDAAVQALVDSAIESLAANYGVFRSAGKAAKGWVTFFTTRRPAQSIPVPLGTVVAAGSRQFRVTRGGVLDLAQIASYYDPTTGQYSLTLPVQALQAGSAGNVARSQVRQIITSSVANGLQATNAADMFGGTPEETNQQLATRAMNKLSSVDSGTAQGYASTMAAVPGVLQSEIVAAGDPLMLRDLYEGEHLGGKVDLWLQGTNAAEVTDTFAFAYEVAKDVQFVVIGSPSDLLFQAIDPELSQATPIAQLLDNPGAGYVFRNATTGEEFDLTGAELVSYNMVQLATDVVQPAVSLTDVVLGDYRRQRGNEYVFRRQPVSSVVSVVGTVAGTLDASEYTLVQPQAPLLNGRSILAQDALRITGVVGEGVEVVDEPHVLLGVYPEYLDSLGVDTLTIQVTNQDGSVVYAGPESSDPDYLIGVGTSTTAATITRVSTGSIPSGATVLVSYTHDENFTVTYKADALVSVAQDAVNLRKHLTADALAKAAVPSPVSLAATVVLKQGAVRSSVDQALRTRLTNFFGGLRLGQPARQSDVVAVIEGTPGVAYVVLPLSRMCLDEGVQIPWETLSSTSTYVASLSTPTVSVWLLDQELAQQTTNGGGPGAAFRGVFQGGVALSVEATTTPLSLGAGRSYIIGADGISLSGVTHPTANRVLVSLAASDPPTTHTYAVCYVTGSPSGVQDLDLGAASYLTFGSTTLDITYDEDSNG